MKPNASRAFWQTTLAFTFAANLGILLWSWARWTEIGVILYRSVWGAALLIYLAVLVGCIFLFFGMKKPAAEKWIAALELDSLSGLFPRIAATALFTSILLLIPWLKFTFRIGEVVKKSTQDPVLTMILFYWVVWWLTLLAAAALKVALKSTWQAGYAAALVILGVAYELFIRAQAFTNYPFSLGWSETSRYYYASLYFSNSIYGQSIPLSTLHPTRYFLQSLAFLVPAGLEWHRLWQLLLWIALTGASVWALSRRIFWGRVVLVPQISHIQSPNHSLGMAWLFAGWIFLFFLRIGVYYHLHVILIVPLLFVSVKHPWRSLVAVIFASVWAGISRVNWFPIPAMIAVAIYLLEEPFDAYTTGRGKFNAVFRYLTLPAIWAVAGLIAALAAQMAYIPLSGNAENARAFTSSFTSDLLWYRLWPNDSYGLGVLPAVLVVCGPLIGVILLTLRKNPGGLHPLRWFGIISMLLVVFVGSLIVSTKIGGGGDLHNMDAYASLQILISLYFLFGQVKNETGARDKQPVPWSLIFFGLFVPLFFLIPGLVPIKQFDQKRSQEYLQDLTAFAEKAAQNGQVLFISERQLLTFRKVNLPIVSDYEAVTLMEMAMSGNQPYLDQFKLDMSRHRFSAIIASKQNLTFKVSGAFAEENNIWNERIASVLVCYYQSVRTYDDVYGAIEIYTPRIEPCQSGVPDQ